MNSGKVEGSSPENELREGGIEVTQRKDTKVVKMNEHIKKIFFLFDSFFSYDTILKSGLSDLSNKTPTLV